MLVQYEYEYFKKRSDLFKNEHKWKVQMRYCFDIGDSFDCSDRLLAEVRDEMYVLSISVYIVYVFHCPECVTGSWAL